MTRNGVTLTLMESGELVVSGGKETTKASEAAMSGEAEGDVGAEAGRSIGTTADTW